MIRDIILTGSQPVPVHLCPLLAVLDSSADMYVILESLFGVCLVERDQRGSWSGHSQSVQVHHLLPRGPASLV